MNQDIATVPAKDASEVPNLETLLTTYFKTIYLEYADKNQSKTAKIAGVARMTAIKYLKKAGVL